VRRDYDRGPCRGRELGDRFYRHQAAPRRAEQHRCRGFESALCGVSHVPAPARVAFVGRGRENCNRTAAGHSCHPRLSGTPPQGNPWRWCHQHPSQASRTSKAAGGQKFSGGFSVLARVTCPTEKGVEGPWPRVVLCRPACSAYPNCHPRQNVKDGHKIAEGPVGGTIPSRASSCSPRPFPAVSRASRAPLRV
jgi:hypothetical protein